MDIPSIIRLSNMVNYNFSEEDKNKLYENLYNAAKADKLDFFLNLKEYWKEFGEKKGTYLPTVGNHALFCDGNNIEINMVISYSEWDDFRYPNFWSEFKRLQLKPTKFMYYRDIQYALMYMFESLAKDYIDDFNEETHREYISNSIISFPPKIPCKK